MKKLTIKLVLLGTFFLNQSHCLFFSIYDEKAYQKALEWQKKIFTIGPLDLSYENLSNTNLQGTDLSGVYLSNTRLNNANLRYANLRRAHLRNAHLRNANLEHANLQGADLKWAKFENTKVNNANFKDVRGLTNKQKAYLRKNGAINVPEYCENEKEKKDPMEVFVEHIEKACIRLWNWYKKDSKFKDAKVENADFKDVKGLKNSQKAYLRENDAINVPEDCEDEDEEEQDPFPCIIL